MMRLVFTTLHTSRRVHGVQHGGADCIKTPLLDYNHNYRLLSKLGYFLR